MDRYVSVCIPAFNRGYCIGRMLDSIIHQTYKNLHIYVCDNASNDNTKQVVKAFNDPRIKYIYFDEYLDVNYSFIRSMKCAEDEIICLFHSDDWYHPDIIEKYLNYIEDESVGAVFSKMRFRREGDSASIPPRDEPPNIIVYDYETYLNQALMEGTIFQCPTFMTKKSVLNKTGILNTNSMMISDMSFWLPIMRKYKCLVINVPLMDYILSDDQLSLRIKSAPVHTIMPEYLLLDAEIKYAKKMNVKIMPDALDKYKSRKKKSLIHLKDSHPSLILKWKYTIIALTNLSISLKSLGLDEKRYLDILYGRES